MSLAGINRLLGRRFGINANGQCFVSNHKKAQPRHMLVLGSGESGIFGSSGGSSSDNATTGDQRSATGLQRFTFAQRRIRVRSAYGRLLRIFRLEADCLWIGDSGSIIKRLYVLPERDRLPCRSYRPSPTKSLTPKGPTSTDKGALAPWLHKSPRSGVCCRACCLQ